MFTRISTLAREHDAVDLGQGYPTWEGPDVVKEAARRAITQESNQYPPSIGIAALRRAIAERWHRDTGQEVDPTAHVTVTSGCTEALSAAFLGIIEPGDEVILFEPAYDAYPADCALAGAVPRFVTLHSPEYRFDPEALRAAISPRTRAVVVNSPHNPTGRVFDDEELGHIAAACREHDLIAITDEVYERIVFDRPLRRLATLPGMWNRTISLSSLGKTFSMTGWKTGWAVGPEWLTESVRAAHQFLTFTTPNPMQHAAVTAFGLGPDYDAQLVHDYRERRDLLARGLESVGFGVTVPEGTYYVLADHSPFGFTDDVAFVDHLITQVGVAAIPPSAFYHRSDEGRRLVRFAFCKDAATMERALELLDRNLG